MGRNGERKRKKEAVEKERENEEVEQEVGEEEKGGSRKRRKGRNTIQVIKLDTRGRYLKLLML